MIAVVLAAQVRRAQRAGVACAIIVQTGTAWPFTMSDAAGLGADVTLPSIMVSPADGDAILQAVKGAATASGGAARVCARAVARDHHTACAVCLQELVASTLAVRLRCGHAFHEGCVRTWLKEKHTCPTCRAPLRSKAEAADEGSQRGLADAEREARALMARGGFLAGAGPPGAGAMYT